MRSKSYSMIRLFTVLMVVICSPAWANTENITMFYGELKLLKDINVDRVAIGNGNLIKVQILPESQLLIIAEAPGSTSLHLWHKDGSESDYNVRISDNDPEQRVRLEKMVKMDVKIVEFRKSRLDELGIDWSKDIAGPSYAVAGDVVSSTLFRGSSDNPIFSNLPKNVEPFQTYFGITSEITSRIKYLESSGDAVTLAQPTLSCRNGGSAKFLAGGEVPYPVVQENGLTTVEFREYGIKLDISPTVDENDVVAASIKTEVSQIDPAVNVMGSPGLLSRRTETEMNVFEGETIVLAGMLNRELADNSDSVPGLGKIPILGWLFKSDNYRNNVTELVVFVTPYVVEAESQSNRNVIDRTEKRLKQRFDQTKSSVEIGILD